jgi:hypothetical protein
MRAFFQTAFVIASVVIVSACGQDNITLPDGGGGGTTGECGSWYPGGGGDAGGDYQFAEGSTLPCFVWESVRIGPKGAEPNTYINVGELYLMAKNNDSTMLQAKFGIDEARALVVAVSAEECSNCPVLMGKLAELEDDLEALGAVMVGVCRHNFFDTSMETNLTMEEADEVLLNEDGWLEDWHRTNDAERHMDLADGIYPKLAVIRLSDMKVVDIGTGADYPVDQIPFPLIPLLEGLDSM